VTVVDGHARAAPASAAEPGPNLDVLDQVQQRVLWLATSIVHGGRTSTEPLAAPTVRAIDAYVAGNHPTTGPLFLDRTGTTRLAYRTAFDQLRRLARTAHIPAAEQITPHSLRHSFVTEALEAGVPLQDVQDAAGHRDPRTTRRYDRSRHNLDRHPTYVLAAHLRRGRARDDDSTPS
jgi:integrase/recombinase XerD